MIARAEERSFSRRPPSQAMTMTLKGSGQSQERGDGTDRTQEQLDFYYEPYLEINKDAITGTSPPAIGDNRLKGYRD